ncbi:MAG: hypothetical protein ISP90_16980 [Nevskia sp.]|nr:hypothetical protein [Nevskia sp.]
MCYSAQAWAAYQRYVREFGAHIAFQDFVRIYGHRGIDPRIRIPKAMDAAFAHPQTAEERRVKALINEWDAGQARKLEADLFKQRARLVDAERKLKAKPTKAAAESKRIAAEKISWALGQARRSSSHGPEAA